MLKINVGNTKCAKGENCGKLSFLFNFSTCPSVVYTMLHTVNRNMVSNAQVPLKMDLLPLRHLKNVWGGGGGHQEVGFGPKRHSTSTAKKKEKVKVKQKTNTRSTWSNRKKMRVTSHFPSVKKSTITYHITPVKCWLSHVASVKFIHVNSQR